MLRNIASQKYRVYAWDTTTGLAKTGDAANISAYITKDDGTPAATNDAAPTEASSTNEPGYYDFDLTQAETNAAKVSLSPKSATANIAVIACPPVVYTRPQYFSLLGIESDGMAHADLKEILGTAVSTSTAQLGVNVVNFGGSAGTFASGRPEVNSSHWGGTAVGSATVNANMTQISGDSTAADSAESFFESIYLGRLTVTTAFSQNPPIFRDSGATTTNDDLYNGAIAVVTDVNGGFQKAIRTVHSWTGSSGEIELVSQLPFTVEVGDTIDLFASSYQAFRALPSDITPGTANGLLRAGTNASTTIDTALVANIVGSITGNLSGSVGSVTAGVTLANDAITAEKYDESTAFPLKSADTGSTAVARTGADSDTLETLSDQIDGVSAGTSPSLMQTTTITGLSSQTVFNLTAGSADNDAYNDQLAVIVDQVTSAQKASVAISDYVGSTKTVTLSAAPVFTIANGDTIHIIAAPPATVSGTVDANLVQIGGVTQSATDLKDFADTGYDPSTHRVAGLGASGWAEVFTVNTGTTSEAAVEGSVAKELYDVIDDNSDPLTVVDGGVKVDQFSTAAKAELQTEANDALVANYLDHWMAVAVTNSDVTNNSALAKLVSKSATAAWSDFVNTDDSLQAQSDNVGPAGAGLTAVTSSSAAILVSTTIATLASQTSFTLTAGSTDNDAYKKEKGVIMVITDQVTSTQKAVVVASAYTGATKTVTLAAAPAFNIAMGDYVDVIATAYTPAPRNITIQADI